ncbi:MAG TPA: sigma-70 family RNA polymerase sigma factor [Gemmataceae bacterium]|jgi:RNA polymerase sigma factor (sigma-70 family)
MAASVAQVLAQVQHWISSPRAADAADAVLLERFVQGREEAAFAELVARHGAMVLRSCRRVLGDVQASEDAFQATFLVLARKAHTLRRPEALSGWLHGVARRVALKARTRSAVRASPSPLPETLSDPGGDPLARLTARELLTVLDEEVQRLPAAQRSAVVLCCLEGHGHEEAARLLGWTAGSLKGHLERGRRRLHARLTRRGIALSAALAVVAVSRGETASMLLQQSAVRAALGGAIGTPATALAESVLKGMATSRLASIGALGMMMALTASALALMYRPPAEPPDKNISVALKEADAGKPEPRVDALGDPLPAGAIARLGTVRFRHADRITFASFTPDGKRLVSRGDDGVRVWDVATGKELRHFAADAGRVSFSIDTDVSPDGKRVAVASSGADGAIQFWDADSGKKIGSLGAKLRPLVRFSPDGKLLATSAAPTNIELWDVAGLKKLRSWKVSPMEVSFIAFSADSRKLLTTSVHTDEIRLWEAATGRLLQEFKPPDRNNRGYLRALSPMALSPDGNLLALVGETERHEPAPGKVEWKTRVNLRDSATGKTVRLLTCPTGEDGLGRIPGIRAVTFTPDGKRLVTGGPDRFVRIWDVKTGEELRRFALESGPAASLTLSRDGKKLAVVVNQDGNAIRVLDLTSGETGATADGHFGPIVQAALTPDGRTAVTSGPDGRRHGTIGPLNYVHVWDAETGRIRRRLDGRGTPFLWMQLSADGRTLFSSGADRTLRVWDVASGQERRRLAVPSEPRNHVAPDLLALTPDGKTLAVMDAAQTIHILDVAKGVERQRFHWPNEVLGMKLTPDGGLLTMWSYDRKVRVRDVRAGRKLHEHSLPQAADQRFPAALSPDGRLLAVMATRSWAVQPLEHSLMLMDLATGQVVHRLNSPLHTGVLAFSPDGSMLAWTSAADTTIRLLEVASGRERRRLTGHRGQITALAFSADCRRLLSGCHDTTALVWDLHPARPATAVEMETLWADLASDDAARAYQAIHRLAAAPDASVSFLRKRLHPVPAVDEKRVARLIADLDRDDFAVRRRAAAELAKLGDQPLAAYRKTFEGKPSLETRRRLEELVEKARLAWWDVSGERLRSLRAVEALELAGTKEARELLESLAGGALGTRLTEQAKAALGRLRVLN